MEHLSKQRWILLSALVIAAILFFIGISTPMMTLSKFIWFENSFSILSGIAQLFDNGQYLIMVIVAGFSLLLPLLKILLLFNILITTQDSSEQNKKALKLMHDYGRWSMLDVMVVAVLIVTVKLGIIATIEIHYGLYVFTAAVFLLMIITHSTNKIVQLKAASN